MALKFSSVLILISVICAIFTGNLPNLTEAALEGGSRGVTTAFSLISLMCLWCGIMKVAQVCSVLDIISSLLKPFLKLVFPNAYKEKKAQKEISACLCANILGIGNAATPLSINAMKALNTEGNTRATKDMVTFTLIGCAPPCLFPTTVIALRSGAGSTSAASIVPAVWIVSTLLCIMSIVLSRIVGIKER